MARKTTTTVVDDMQPGAGTGDIQEPLSEATLDEMLALEDIAATLGAGVGQARVYRIERNGDAAFVGEFVAAELTEGKIQEDFGGGKYVVKFLNSQKQYVKQRTIIIAEPRKKDGDLLSQFKEIQNGKNGGLDMMAFMQMQLQMSERAEARSTQMITALIGALGNKGGNSGGSASEIVQAVVALKGATEPATNLFSGVEQVVKIAQMIGGKGGADKEDNAWSVIRDVAPGIAETLFKGRGGVPQPNPPGPGRVHEVREISPGSAQPVSIPSAIPAASAATATELEAPMQKQIRLLRESCEFLKEKARKQKDVDLMVDYVLSFDEGEDEKFDVLIGAIQTYSFDTLAGQDADIGGPLRGWFEAFYNGVKNELQRNDNSGGNTGNAPNTPSNGASSETSELKPVA